MWFLTSVDSDELRQSTFRVRNSMWCSISSLAFIEYSSDYQRLWSDCAYAQADLKLCLSHTRGLRLSGSVIQKSRFIFTKEGRTIRQKSGRQKSGCLNHLNNRIFQVNTQMQGKIKDFWKGVYMFKGVGVRFADIISLTLNIPWKWNNLVSLSGEGRTLLDPPLQHAADHLLRTEQ